MEHRFNLEKYTGINSRHQCPGCDCKNSFVLYVDARSNTAIHASVGKCNRENKCGYHYTPAQFFTDYPDRKPDNDWVPKIKAASPAIISFLQRSLVVGSLKNQRNSFTDFLIRTFGEERAYQVISKYFIGSSRYWNGSCVFWQIDHYWNVRSGKIMVYDRSGHRDKKRISWVHSILKVENFNLKQCFFGQHLLQCDISKAIAVVESEKTAVIASIYMPEFIWMACGSLQNINKERCRVLAGRKVILFPDLKGFDLWNTKAKELGFACSDYLEKVSSPSEKEKGLDIADYLLLNPP